MFSHLWGMRVAAIVAAAALLSACRTFSPDGGMNTVAMVAWPEQDIVQIRSAEDEAAVRTRVTRLLHRPLSADAAVQIMLADTANGSDVNVSTGSLSPGNYYLVLLDYAGTATRYEVCVAVTSCPTPFPAPSAAPTPRLAPGRSP